MLAKPQIAPAATRRFGTEAASVTQQVLRVSEELAFNDALLRSSDPRALLARTTPLMTASCARIWRRAVDKFARGVARGEPSQQEFSDVYTIGLFNERIIFANAKGDGVAKRGPAFVNPKIKSVKTTVYAGRLDVRVQSAADMRVRSAKGRAGNWHFTRRTDFYMKKVGNRWLIDGWRGVYNPSNYPF